MLIPPEALPVTTVAVHPRSSAVIFAGANSQIHRSDDGGVNWNVKTLPDSGQIKEILIHPANPQNMYIILGR